ncbi:MAG TPA: DUF456 domain-containing protein [Opitutaceae bacterium]|nr:DUF456 domain-containing protein [Opitutaceae bacterium]
MVAVLTWCLTSCLMLIGLVGVVVPILPGTTLIIAAAIIHKLIIPESVSWTIIGVVAVVWFVSLVVDIGGVLLGTKLFGGTRWGMAGASGGALVGMFISFPALLVGTIGGAILAEKFFAKKTSKQSLRAGLGTATGFVISTGLRLLCAAAMIAIFLVAALSDRA